MSLSMDPQAWTLRKHIPESSTLRSSQFSISISSAWKAKHDILDNKNLRKEIITTDSTHVFSVPQRRGKYVSCIGGCFAIGYRNLRDAWRSSSERKDICRSRTNYVGNSKQIIKVDTLTSKKCKFQLYFCGEKSLRSDKLQGPNISSHSKAR